MQSVLCAMQITDVDLMELIRKNIKLTIPYAGAFLKRDDRYSTWYICIYMCVYTRSKLASLAHSLNVSWYRLLYRVADLGLLRIHTICTMHAYKKEIVC